MSEVVLFYFTVTFSFAYFVDMMQNDMDVA